MASPWEALVELYDKLRAAGKPVCPIAHTYNVAPHLISDQIKYIADRPGQTEKHKAYIKQLKNYIYNNSNDIYAKFIDYIVKLSNDKIKSPEKANNVVCMDFNGACYPERVQALFLCR